MMNHNESRRTAIQQVLLATAAFCVQALTASAQTDGEDKPIDPLQPFYLPPMAPLQPGPGGLDIRTWVKSAQTNGQYSCVEFAAAAKKMGPAPHYHKTLDELMFVLDGTVSVLVEDKLYEVPAGAWHFRPRGMVHTFFNNTDKPFRAIDMYFNQNFEDYLEELFHQIIPEVQRKKLSFEHPLIAKRMYQLHKKYKMVGFPEKRQAIVDQYGLW